jgi:hypothetical protein
MMNENDSQPDYKPKRSEAYKVWAEKPPIVEDRQTVLINIAKGMNSPEFQTFVDLVGKDVAQNFLRRIIDNK